MKLEANRANMLEAELRKAKEAAAAGGGTASGTASAISSPSAGTTPGAGTVSMEKYTELQTDLNELYRRNSEYSKQVVEKTTENKRLSDTVQEREREIAELQARCKKVEEAAATSDATIKDKELTLSVLRSEMRGLMVKLVKSEEDLRKAKEELEVVCNTLQTTHASCTSRSYSTANHATNSWRRGG